MRRTTLFLAVAALLIAGCGGGHSTTHRQAPPPATYCPQVANGNGSPGACAPKSYGLGTPRKTPPPQNRTATSTAVYPDLSNNDPCYCGASLKAQGRVGLIVKANQGTSFIDSTAVGMVQSARAAGLAVGMYDFDSTYTVAEAQVFVQRLHAAGIYPTSANSFPAYLDVEYGAFNYAGLEAQIAYLRGQGYRVGIYTGNWYWAPHAGCRWPTGVSAWLSGYPTAPVPCGTTGYNSHQFTDRPIDLSVFLGSADQFHTFVNATPPPPADPYAVYPAGPVSIHNQKVSERSTVVAWWKNHCRNPVRRPVCKSTRLHLVWLHDRLHTIALLASPSAPPTAPVWSAGPKGQTYGVRYFRIGRILASK